jgi:hypothetical protein
MIMHRRVGLATMDVGGWLRSLGLEQYEPAFRKNKIDGSVLPGLTNEDLKDLGGCMGIVRPPFLPLLARFVNAITSPILIESSSITRSRNG